MPRMRCARWAGRCAAVVRNIGQVTQALAWGQAFCTGRPQYPLGRASVSEGRRRLAQAASASGPSGSRVTVAPVMSTLRAGSQCRRTVLSGNLA